MLIFYQETRCCNAYTINANRYFKLYVNFDQQFTAIVEQRIVWIETFIYQKIKKRCKVQLNESIKYLYEYDSVNNIWFI